MDTGNRICTHLILGGAKGMLAEQDSLIRKIPRGLSAVRQLREARDINPDDTGVLFAWGSYYLIAPRAVGGDIEKAETNLLAALEKDPKFADIHARLAHLYFEEGDKEKAERYIQSAKELDERSPILKEVLKKYGS